METVAGKAQFGEFGNFTFTGAGDAGSRPYLLHVAAVDVPFPRTPSGLDPAFKYGLTRAAVEEGGALIAGKPIRMDPTLTSHDDWVVTVGGASKRLATPYGYNQSSQIIDEDGIGYWAIAGQWWPHQDPELTRKVEAELPNLGGSWEMQVWVDKQPDGNGVKWIRKIMPTGAAILRQSAAAGQDFTKLIYASALPECDCLPAAAREAFLTNYQIQDGATAMASLAVADPAFPFDSQTAKANLLAWAAVDGAVDPTRARLVFLLQQGDSLATEAWDFPVADIFDDGPRLVAEAVREARAAASDGALELTNTQKDQLLATCRRLLARWDETDVAYAAAGQGGPDMGDTNDLATRYESVVAREAALQAKFDALTEQLSAQASAAEAAQTESAAAQAASDTAQVENETLTARVTELETALASATEALAEATAKAETAQAEAFEAQASAWVKDREAQYAPEALPAVKSAKLKQLKGECPTEEEFEAMASGKAPSVAPEGDDSELQSAEAQASGAPELHEQFKARLNVSETDGGFGGSRDKMQAAYNAARIAQMRGEG